MGIVRRINERTHSVPHLYEKMMLDTPGTWWKLMKNGQVLFKCPKNHTAQMAPKGFTRKGRSASMFRCPTKDCGFHKRLRLEDWRT